MIYSPIGDPSFDFFSSYKYSLFSSYHFKNLVFLLVVQLGEPAQHFSQQLFSPDPSPLFNQRSTVLQQKSRKHEA